MGWGGSGRCSSWTDTPWKHTSPPPLPESSSTLKHTRPWRHIPPGSTAPWKDKTPLEAHTPPAHPPGQTPPQKTLPLPPKVTAVDSTHLTELLSCFLQFSAKILSINRLVLPLRGLPPSLHQLKNPGSTTSLTYTFSGGSRIFPRRGRQLPGGYQHTILQKFPKNCMKLKEFGPPGGRTSKILLCRSATDFLRSNAGIMKLNCLN